MCSLFLSWALLRCHPQSHVELELHSPARALEPRSHSVVELGLEQPLLGLGFDQPSIPSPSRQ